MQERIASVEQNSDGTNGIEGSGLPIPIQHQIWAEKYRFSGGSGTDYPADRSIKDTWGRVAWALSQAEKPEERSVWEAKFFETLQDFKFIPAGRIIGGAGTGRNVTLFNCFMMGAVPIRSAASSITSRKPPRRCSKAAASASISQRSGPRAPPCLASVPMRPGR